MTHNLFFYGTLIHPEVLSRVIGKPGVHLTTNSANLESHTRFHVKGEDYPAVVDNSAARAVMGRDLSEEEGRVKGCLVQGLTDEDVKFLDSFEGDEYIRSSVKVSLLSTNSSPLSLDSTSSTSTNNFDSTLTSTLIKAETYLWSSPLSRLSPSIWSYEEFFEEKAHRWVGKEAGNEYEEVDRRRAMLGNIEPSKVSSELIVEKVNGLSIEEEKDLPVFGKAFREKEWSFEKGWVNLNHGSYGAAPKVVIAAARKIQDASAAAPDRFMRKTYMTALINVRGRLASLVGCDTDDLVVVANATTGVNAVLNSLSGTWQPNDKLLYFSTTIYDACGSNLLEVVNTHSHLNLSLLPISVAYPITHANLIETTRKAIEEVQASGGRIALALIDALSSNPGVVVPWEELVILFKEKGIISLVDAAHQIGQLPVNLRESKPDYWLSNCHKWLLGTRSCAVLYVAKKNQHLIHSVPIAHSYKVREASDLGVPSWISEFEWNGTIDWSPVLSLDAALDFRLACGGEERIRSYCHNLAIEGGELVAKALGTESMRNENGGGELVANMINIRLPVSFPSSDLPLDEQKTILSKQRTFLYMYQIDFQQTCIPAFVHNKIWWVRLSAQIYNDLDDFKIIAESLDTLCKKLEDEGLCNESLKDMKLHR